MKLRIILFIVTLLSLPPLGLLLAGQDQPPAINIGGDMLLPALLSGIVLLALAILLDRQGLHRNGSSLLRARPDYTLWLGATGALLCALLVYLNAFCPLWIGPLARPAEMLLAALLGSVLLPTILVTRHYLAGFPPLLRKLTHITPLPTLPAEPVAALLLIAACVGLLGGSVWPAQLAWLFWLSPLLLLIALQLLWHESTVFSGMRQGDWSRIGLGTASGILVGGGTLAFYQLAGGALYLPLPTWLSLGLMAAFGLLCLQAGDLIAEHWRGTSRGAVLKKKPFPIPIVIKKDS